GRRGVSATSGGWDAEGRRGGGCPWGAWPLGRGRTTAAPGGTVPQGTEGAERGAAEGGRERPPPVGRAAGSPVGSGGGRRGQAARPRVDAGGGAGAWGAWGAWIPETLASWHYRRLRRGTGFWALPVGRVGLRGGRERGGTPVWGRGCAIRDHAGRRR